MTPPAVVLTSKGYAHETLPRERSELAASASGGCNGTLGKAVEWIGQAEDKVPFLNEVHDECRSP